MRILVCLMRDGSHYSTSKHAYPQVLYMICNMYIIVYMYRYIHNIWTCRWTSIIQTTSNDSCKVSKGRRLLFNAQPGHLSELTHTVVAKNFTAMGFRENLNSLHVFTPFYTYIYVYIYIYLNESIVGHQLYFLFCAICFSLVVSPAKVAPRNPSGQERRLSGAHCRARWRICDLWPRFEDDHRICRGDRWMAIGMI